MNTLTILVREDVPIPEKIKCHQRTTLSIHSLIKSPPISPRSCTLYKEYAPDTEMPEHPVYFGVSQEYANPDAILPIVPGNTHVRECLETVQHCMGSSRRERAGYSESHETMVTGALGKKATFATTARNQRRMIPFLSQKRSYEIQDKSPE